MLGFDGQKLSLIKRDEVDVKEVLMEEHCNIHHYLKHLKTYGYGFKSRENSSNIYVKKGSRIF